MISRHPVFLSLLFSASVWADGDRVEIQKVSDLKIELAEERVVFNVSIQTLDRDQIREKQTDDEIEAWHGEEKLPPEVLWLRPTIVRAFSLQIDGQTINIPARFWNDLAGLSLHTVRLVVDDPTQEDQLSFEDSLSEPRLRPQISRSANGGTVLITWARPEECDQTTTFRWIISKKGTVLRHHEVPEHQ